MPSQAAKLNSRKREKKSKFWSFHFINWSAFELFELISTIRDGEAEEGVKVHPDDQEIEKWDVPNTTLTSMAGKTFSMKRKTKSST